MPAAPEEPNALSFAGEHRPPQNSAESCSMAAVDGVEAERSPVDGNTVMDGVM